jgi:hypothetical protein
MSLHLMPISFGVDGDADEASFEKKHPEEEE